jgi:hypothetical protein
MLTSSKLGFSVISDSSTPKDNGKAELMKAKRMEVETAKGRIGCRLHFKSETRFR